MTGPPIVPDHECAPNTPAAGNGKAGRVVTVGDVAPERVRWLWRRYLAAGKTTLFDGDPGDGKSTLALDLGARYTTGAAWPDGTPGGPAGDVLILSAEDGIADTIRPRLDAAGADVRRVHVLTEVEECGFTRPPDLVNDLDMLAEAVTNYRAGLVIIDPLMAFMGGGVDSHRDQDVRRVLHPLAKLADASGVALLVVRHLNKSGGSKAVYRGGGSIGIVGAARLAYLVAADPDDNDRRVLAPVKLNLCDPPAALAYRLVTDEAHDVARIRWEGHTGHRAGDLLRVDEEDRTERDEAADWLADWLHQEGGQAAAADVKKAARAAGLAVRTVERARSRVASTHSAGFPRRSLWVLNSSRATAPNPSKAGATGGGGATVDISGVPDGPSHPPRQSRHPGETSAGGATGTDGPDGTATPDPQITHSNGRGDAGSSLLDTGDWTGGAI